MGLTDRLAYTDTSATVGNTYIYWLLAINSAIYGLPRDGAHLSVIA
jgi:hypothetical protein